jgi:nitric oxide reductase NorQ protein
MAMAAQKAAQLEQPATVAPDEGRDFLTTPDSDRICGRALRYLRSGYPVHFRGSAGTGKTALALHVAHGLGRPVVFFTGDATFTSENLIGRASGTKSRQVIDRYVHSVRKIENETTQVWVDEVLTQACLNGWTMVYDEFTRSRPEANNVLLPVLQERMLILPAASRGQPYIRIHPEFRAIFTSNSLEYVGVHKTQDALLDRMITLDLDYMDRASEVAIVRHRTGMAEHLVGRIVDAVRDYRESGAYDQVPTLRASLMIADIAMREGLAVSAGEPAFVDLCLDVLASKVSAAAGAAAGVDFVDLLRRLIALHCPAEEAPAPAAARKRKAS